MTDAATLQLLDAPNNSYVGGRRRREPPVQLTSLLSCPVLFSRSPFLSGTGDYRPQCLLAFRTLSNFHHRFTVIHFTHLSSLTRNPALHGGRQCPRCVLLPLLAPTSLQPPFASRARSAAFRACAKTDERRKCVTGRFYLSLSFDVSHLLSFPLSHSHRLTLDGAVGSRGILNTN